MALGNFLNLFLQQSHLLASNFDNCERQNTIAAVLRWQCRKCANQGGYRSRKKLGLQWLSSKQCQTRVADCRLLLWAVNYFRTFLGPVIAWPSPCGVSNLDIIVHLLLCWELHATIYTLSEKRAWYFVENHQQIVSLFSRKAIVTGKSKKSTKRNCLGSRCCCFDIRWCFRQTKCCQ